MKFIVKNLFIVVCLLLSNSLLATIEIISLEHPTIGQNDGCVEIQATGDSGPFDIAFQNGGSCATQISGTAECCGLGPGLYTIIVTDAHGCTETLEFELEEQECDLDVTIVSQEDATYHDQCSGQGSSSDGSITVDFGVADLSNYTVTWRNAIGQVVSGTQSINNLSPGFYTLHVQHNQIEDCTFSKLFVKILNGKI